MNYYNPYFSYYPYTTSLSQTSKGFLSRLFGNGINIGSILTNTQKTLGIINQGIPMIKQISPVIKNAKTMFKVLNEFKKEDAPNINEQFIVENIYENNRLQLNTIEKRTNNNGPTFYI